MPTISTPDDDYSCDVEDYPACETCGCYLEWDDCDLCGGEGYSGHDCGEDVCCCLEPEDNEVCGQCSGRGGWWWCPNAKEHEVSNED